MILQDIESGEIPKTSRNVVSVTFIEKALKRIVDEKWDPSIALGLIPSSGEEGFYTRTEARENASRDRVLAEVVQVWFYFTDYFDSVSMDDQQFGARARAVAAAVIKFSKSKRVIDRFFSAFKLHYKDFLELAEELGQLEKSSDVEHTSRGRGLAGATAYKKWWREFYRVTERRDQLLDAIATVAFGRPKTRAKK